MRTILSRGIDIGYELDGKCCNNCHILVAVWEWLPVAAAVFAVPQFLPQLLAVWRTGDTAGVSWSWAALTSVSNGGWIVYFGLSRLWTALVPATSATVLAGLLAVLLGRHGGVPRRPALLAGGWAAVLALAWIAAGRAGIGTALTVSFVLQVTPSVRAAYRTRRPTGISRGTWLLILAELLCWGVYGLHRSDPRLTVLGLTGVAASLLILARRIDLRDSLLACAVWWMPAVPCRRKSPRTSFSTTDTPTCTRPPSRR
jgi:uncharacterized protein with PQ loop repeat